MNATDPRLDRLAVELDITVRRLQWMHAQLAEMRATSSPVRHAVPDRRPAPESAPRPLPPPRPIAGAATPQTAGEIVPQCAAFDHPAMTAQGRVRRSLTIARILAGAGVVVTLVGVALLLVLAAHAGFFGPPVRVVLGALVALALLGAALWLRPRPGGRIGAPALAATAFAAAYLDIAAVTALYGWVAPAIGLVAAGMVALSGLVLATRWRSQWLAIALFAPVYPLAVPLVTDPRMLAAFALVLALASLGAARPDAMPWLHLVRSVGTSATLLALVVGSSGADQVIATGAAILGAAIAMLAGAIRAARTGHSWPLVISGVIGTVPVLFALPTVALPMAVAATAAITCAALALGLLPDTAAQVRGTWFAAAAVVTVVGVLATTPHHWAGAVLLALAVTALVAGGRVRAACWSAAALGGVGILAAASVLGAGLGALHGADFPGGHSSDGAAVVTALVAVVLAVVSAWRLIPLAPHDQRPVVGVLAGALLLGSVTSLFAHVGWAVAGTEGLRWGHGLATVVWMILGAVGLMSRRLPRRAAVTTAALVTMGAAVAKLFLWDLAALDGVIRVIAFLAVGVILLGLGASFAARSDRGEEPVRSHP